MPILSSHRDSWYLSPLFAVCCLLQAIPPAEAQQQFDDKVIAAWKAYEQFAQSLQGTTHSVTHYIAKKDYTDTVRYRQNREAFLTFAHANEDPYETVSLTNPLYSAELRRNVTDPTTVVLRDLKLEPEAPLRSSGGTPLWTGVFLGTSPHFQYWGTKLSDLVSQPSFVISGIAMERRDGHEWLRVQFRYLLDQRQQRQRFQREGLMYLDPNRSWCLRQVKEAEKIFRNGILYRTMDWDWQYEVMDHPSGFPIIQRCMATYDGNYQKDNRKSRGDIRTEYQLEVDDAVPTSEFTLSAFGLPEPMGVKPLPKSHAWLWLLMAAITAAALAILFSWLKRRHTKATSATF